MDKRQAWVRCGIEDDGSFCVDFSPGTPCGLICDPDGTVHLLFGADTAGVLAASPSATIAIEAMTAAPASEARN